MKVSHSTSKWLLEVMELGRTSVKKNASLRLINPGGNTIVHTFVNIS